MTDNNALAKAVIVRARPSRPPKRPVPAKYLVTIFAADGAFEVSPRLAYADALRYAGERNAEIVSDESVAE